MVTPLKKAGELRPERVNQGPTSRPKLGEGLYSMQGARLSCSVEGVVREEFWWT